MKRREFLNKAGIGLAATTLAKDSFGIVSEMSGQTNLKAIDVQNYLRSLCVVNEPSVDRIIIGDPETKVKKIATAWMPYWSTLKQGVNEGYNIFVVHEPTFYTHWDLDRSNSEYHNGPEAARKAYLDLVEEKKEWINRNEIVIIRSHDVPDKAAEWGIPYSLGLALGYTNSDIIQSATYYNIYGFEKQTALQFARNVASRLKVLGQPGVAFYGDPDRMVSNVGVGTGYISNPMQFMDLNPDVYIAINDTINTWTQCTYAEDSGHPLIVIDHGTSEDNGMRLVSLKLKEVFNGIEIQHFQQGCTYKWVSA